MENMDTIHLLKECDAGTKMAVTSIDEILENVTNPAMKQILSKSKQHHKQLEKEIHCLLADCNSDEKDPALMALGMSWLKTNFKLTMESGDAVVAVLITEGCDMGIRSLYKYLNQYSAASETAKAICNKVITIEDDLRRDLRCYL